MEHDALQCGYCTPGQLMAAAALLSRHGALTDDDILFLDLGPIFAEWEADFGRTYVLGDDPVKQMAHVPSLSDYLWHGL